MPRHVIMIQNFILVNLGFIKRCRNLRLIIHVLIFVIETPKVCFSSLSRNFTERKINNVNPHIDFDIIAIVSSVPLTWMLPVSKKL